MFIINNMTDLEWILIGVGTFIIFVLIGIIVIMYGKCYSKQVESAGDYHIIPDNKEYSWDVPDVRPEQGFAYDTPNHFTTY